MASKRRSRDVVQGSGLIPSFDSHTDDSITPKPRDATVPGEPASGSSPSEPDALAQIRAEVHDYLRRLPTDQDQHLLEVLPELGDRATVPPPVRSDSASKQTADRGPASFDGTEAAGRRQHLLREVDRYLAGASPPAASHLLWYVSTLVPRSQVAPLSGSCEPAAVEQEKGGGPASTSLGPSTKQKAEADELAGARAPSELVPVDAAWSDLQASLEAYRESTRKTLEDRLRELIHNLPQGHFGSLARNRAFVAGLNRFLDQGNWTLVAPNGRAARLQIVNPGGSTTGYFALRHSDSTKYRVPKEADTTSLASLLPSVGVRGKLTRHGTDSP